MKRTRTESGQEEVRKVSEISQAARGIVEAAEYVRGRSAARRGKEEEQDRGRN